jgi:thioredoxin-like negative regulator of GroEL
MLTLATLLLTTSLLSVPANASAEASLTWHPGPFTNTIGAARSSEKPVLIYFWSNRSNQCSQCSQCSQLWTNTLKTPKAADFLGDFTMYSVDTGTKQGYSLVERFNITTLPTLLILDSSGKPDDVILGAISIPNLGS